MELTQITTQPGAGWVSAWAPDGTALLVASEYGDDDWDLYRAELDGERQRITCHVGGVARVANWIGW
jgi:Tol biopolymer transport system component